MGREGFPMSYCLVPMGTMGTHGCGRHTTYAPGSGLSQGPTFNGATVHTWATIRVFYIRQSVLRRMLNGPLQKSKEKKQKKITPKILLGRQNEILKIKNVKTIFEHK